MSESVDVRLELTPEDIDVDDPRWVSVCQDLMRHLQITDGITVSSPPTASLSPYAKGEPISIGAFILALSAAPAVVALAETLKAWVSQLGNRRIHISITQGDQQMTLESSGFSEAKVRAIVDKFSEAWEEK